jgi:hypothetical protein
VLGRVVLKLYRGSLYLEYIPQRWRTANIVILRNQASLTTQDPRRTTYIVARDNQ